MREIKFRAWVSDEGEMAPWEELVSGYYHMDEFVEPDGLIFMQYTGLKDKQGKEIYERDILDWYGVHMVIAWDATFASWQMQTPSGLGSMQFHAGDAEGVKVVGNIYENPELIKKEK